MSLAMIKDEKNLVVCFTALVISLGLLVSVSYAGTSEEALIQAALAQQQDLPGTALSFATFISVPGLDSPIGVVSGGNFQVNMLPNIVATFAPNGSTVAYMGEHESQNVLTIGKTILNDLDARDIVFSQNSDKIVCIIKRDKEQLVGIIDVKSPEKIVYKTCDSGVPLLPSLSPDNNRVAFYSYDYDHKKVCVVVDNNKGPYFDFFCIGDPNRSDSIILYPPQRPIFSPDGTRIAYVATRKGKKFVVLDGKESQLYDAVSNLVFSLDGSKLAYKVKTGNDCMIVVNEKGSEKASIKLLGAEGPFFDSSGQLIYLAYQQGKSFIVYGATIKAAPKEEASFDVVAWTVGPTGQTAFWREDSNRNWELMLNDQKIFELPESEFHMGFSNFGAPVFTSDGGLGFGLWCPQDRSIRWVKVR